MITVHNALIYLLQTTQPCAFLCDVLVEILYIELVGDLWFDGWLDLKLVHLFPIHIREPGMLPDLTDILVPDPVLRALLKTFLDQVLQLLTDLDHVGEGWVKFDHPVQHNVVVLIVEGRKSINHLVKQDPVAPNIHRLVVSLLENDLWGDVLRGADEGGGLLLPLQLLRDAEVSETGVPIFVQEDVLRLHVAVHDVE